MEAAPLHEDVADAPDGGAAHWLTTKDGLRIRVGHWTFEGAKGTVFLFPGRTEFVEKYGRSAAELRARGYATVAIDWRGQGLADRMAKDRGLGHVKAFRDYQHDVDAMLDHVRALGLPEPYHLLAHSMGGCIGLRALHKDLPVASAAFSAPMWGMMMSPFLRPAAWGVSTIARAFGLTDMVVPGQTTENYLGRTTLADNLLTSDAEFFDHLENQLRTHPELGIGGPSTLWLNESLMEMNRLDRMPSPKVPAITFLGTLEAIVDPGRIRNRMKRWPNGKLVILNGAKHEPMMDSPDMRTSMFDQMCAVFDQQS